MTALVNWENILLNIKTWWQFCKNRWISQGECLNILEQLCFYNHIELRTIRPFLHA